MLNFINKIINIIKSTDNTYILVGYAFLFLFSILFFFSITKYFKDHQIIRRFIAKARHNREVEIAIHREEIKRKVEFDDEKRTKLSFLSKIDLLLLRSGLKDKISEIEADSFMLIIMFLATIAIFVTTSLTKNIVMGLIVAAALVFTIFFILLIMVDKKRSDVEEDLELFLNLLENYSAGSDSMYAILEKVAKKVPEPLKTYLEDCCYELRIRSSRSIALANLKEKIDHPQFKKIISNLELAADHEANYSQIIDLNNTTLSLYLEMQKKKRAINKNARIELIFMGISGIAILWIASTFNLIKDLFASSLNQFILIYLIIVLLIGFLTTLKK